MLDDKCEQERVIHLVSSTSAGCFSSRTLRVRGLDYWLCSRSLKTVSGLSRTFLVSSRILLKYDLRRTLTLEHYTTITGTTIPVVSNINITTAVFCAASPGTWNPVSFSYATIRIDHENMMAMSH